MTCGVKCPFKYAGVVQGVIASGLPDGIKYFGDTYAQAYEEAVGCHGATCGIWDRNRNCCGLINVVD